MLAEGGATSAMQQAYMAGVAPALGSLELNSLAMVLANLQEQILHGKFAALTINSEEHLKHAGTAARSRRFVFEKIVQVLVGLRLLSPGSDGALTSYSPILADKWRRLGDGGEFEIGIKLTALGPELLLGFSDAHSDMVRFARGLPEAIDVLRGQPPLTIWRSIWLELAGLEQLIYLRMERGMQWEFRWLQLEGIFGMPLAELFGDCELPEQRGAELGGELAKRLKFSARLGRKLVDQGFLAPGVTDHYLAFGTEEAPNASGVTLVWQASRERLATDAASAYRRAVAAAIVQGWFDQFVPTMMRICLPAAGDTALWGPAEALWRELLALPGPKTGAPIELQPGQLLLPQVLFFEYALRGQAASAWPLPAGVAAGPLGELTRDLQAPNLKERCERFWALVEDDIELQQALREEPLMTLASLASRGVPEFAQQIKQAAGISTVADEQAVEVKPRLIAPNPAAEVPMAAPERPARPAPVSGALAARMLKIASDELAKMRASDPARYQQLKLAYLETLDETSRRLLLDVQKRIQPSMFDEQLRQRLVRYMVENPGAWRSAEVGKTGNT